MQAPSSSIDILKNLRIDACATRKHVATGTAILVAMLYQSWQDDLVRKQFSFQSDAPQSEKRDTVAKQDRFATPSLNKQSQRSWLAPDRWVFGDPQQVIWISLVIFAIAYRSFRDKRPHHEIGCFVAIVSTVGLIFGQVVTGNVHDPGNSLCMAITCACFGYAVGVVFCRMVIWKSLWTFSKRLRPKSTVTNTSISQQLSNIQVELDSQLQSLEKSSLDEETVADLKETAKIAAADKMSCLLESVSDQDGD